MRVSVCRVAYHVIANQQLQVQHDLLTGQDGRFLPVLERFGARASRVLQFFRGSLWYQGDELLRGLQRGGREGAAADGSRGVSGRWCKDSVKVVCEYTVSIR